MRYQIIRVYSDGCMTESTNDLIAAMQSAAIYMGDRDLDHICIYDWEKETDILDYWR